MGLSALQCWGRVSYRAFHWITLSTGDTGPTWENHHQMRAGATPWSGNNVQKHHEARSQACSQTAASYITSVQLVAAAVLGSTERFYQNGKMKKQTRLPSLLLPVAAPASCSLSAPATSTQPTAGLAAACVGRPPRVTVAGAAAAARAFACR